MKTFKKIKLSGAVDQLYNNFACPECNYNFINRKENSFEHIIGYNNHPRKKGDKSFAVIFECPKCFVKSFCHATGDYIESLKRLFHGE